jgi:hypothetical protein
MKYEIWKANWIEWFSNLQGFLNIEPFMGMVTVKDKINKNQYLKQYFLIKTKTLFYIKAAK